MAVQQKNIDFFNEVQKLIATGMNPSEAARKLGRNPTRYHQIKHFLKKEGRNVEQPVQGETKETAKRKYTKRKVKVVDLTQNLPVQSPQRAMLFVGSAQELMNIARSLG